jgi:hypothetical protein
MRGRAQKVDRQVPPDDRAMGFCWREQDQGRCDKQREEGRTHGLATCSGGLLGHEGLLSLRAFGDRATEAGACQASATRK